MHTRLMEGVEMRAMFCAEMDPRGLLNCLLQSIDLKIHTVQATSFPDPWDAHISDQQACFYVVVNGCCSLQLEGIENPFVLNRGDMAVLLHHRAHSLASVGSGNSGISFVTTRPGSSPRTNPSKDTLIRGVFHCGDNDVVALLQDMPPVILANSGNEDLIPWILGTARMIVHESCSGRPGAQAVVNDLVHLMFAQRIRTPADLESSDQPGMQEFFRHPQIGLALYQMQMRLQEHWSVTKLARACGMSRSAFAYEFKNVVDISPMAYLFELRMRMACRLLQDPDIKIREVCEKVGYKSQPSFAQAFIGRTGIPPGAYRKAHARHLSEHAA